MPQDTQTSPRPAASRPATPASPAAPAATRVVLPPWRQRRVYYLRALSLVLLFTGLWQCAYALGVFDWQGRAFLDLRGPARNALATFAVLDLVTAVGLWLGAAWGPVLFGVDVLAIVALRTFASETHGTAPVLNAVWLLLLAVVVAFWALVTIEDRTLDAVRRKERKESRRRPGGGA